MLGIVKLTDARLVSVKVIALGVITAPISSILNHGPEPSYVWTVKPDVTSDM